MDIQTTRFGTLSLDLPAVLNFPRGLLGLPGEHDFVLLRHRESNAIGWLQSVKTPALALPVVAASELAPDYPEAALESAIRRAEMDENAERGVLVVLTAAAHGNMPTVNLAAPILVDMNKLTAVQVIPDCTALPTREVFALKLPASESVARAMPAAE